MKQKLDQKQVQKLVMAPALQQAIRLLQLTNLELQEVINQELEENPLLETEEEAPQEILASSPAAEEVKSEEELEPASGAPDEFDEIIFAAGFQDYFDEEIPYSGQGEQDRVPFENLVSRSPSLWDHLKLAGWPDFLKPTSWR